MTYNPHNPLALTAAEVWLTLVVWWAVMLAMAWIGARMEARRRRRRRSRFELRRW